MSLRIIPKHLQAHGAFNRGQIIENKPIGFPQDGGHVRPYSSLFYWARAEALVDSTIGLHPHQGFEIMSFVLEGRIRHYDSKNQVWKPLEKGDVQIIRAGSGIQHAEHVEKGGVIFQIWVDPNLQETLEQPASYDDYPASAFPVVSENGHQRTIHIGEGSPLTLDTQPLRITREKVDGEWLITPGEDTITSLYIIEGSGLIADQSFGKDDFIIIENEEEILMETDGEVDVFRIDVPRETSYPTYAEKFHV
jgi:redox-sensitive bicupin YhaK (pirin superfamily)